MGKTEYGFNHVAVYGLLERDEKVLLLERKNTIYMNGMYSLPAGRVEPGETMTQAVIREIKEEVGLNVAAESLRPVHLAHRVQDSYVDVFFTAKDWQGEPVNMEPDKCGDVSWHAKDRLPENTIPFIGLVIGHIALGRAFSEYEEEPS